MKRKNDNKTEVISCRVSSRDKKQLIRLAKAAKVTLAEIASARITIGLWDEKQPSI